jgi:hypothetical protein
MPKYGVIGNPSEHPVPEVEYDETGMPVMPLDVTAITLRELGQLFQAMEAWHAYFTSMATDADLERVKHKEILDMVKAHVKSSLRVAVRAKTDADDLVKLDMRYIEANARYLESKAMADRIENLRSMVSRRFNLISREITRRSDENRYDTFNPEKRFTDTTGSGGRNDEKDRPGYRQLR